MSTLDKFEKQRKGQLVIIVPIGEVQDEVMCGDEWLQLRKSPDGYTYAHEIRCHGQIVSVLVFRTDTEETPILGRYERNPAHRDMSHPMDYYAIPLELSSITGGVEEGQCPCETAIMETEEEAGYRITEDQLIELGTVRPSKGMDTTVHMFAVDVTGMEQGEAKGDGSQGEEEAHTNWISIDDAVACKDALMATMIARYYGISR